MNEQVEFISLCNVWVDSYDKIWLGRLADIHNGKLETPYIDEDLPKQFGNRDRLYWSNGPKEDGSIGVWRWTATPRDTDFMKDYITSDFQQKLRPARVVIVKHIHSTNELLDKIVSGISTHKYSCDIMFSYESEPQKYTGVLVKYDQLLWDSTIHLKEDVFNLPIYHFDEAEVYTVKSSLRFMRSLPIEPSDEYISVGSKDNLLKQLLLKKITRPLFKEVIGGTKADWKNCKIIVESVCDATFYEEVATLAKCSLEQATQLVENFVDRANNIFSIGDIDSEILSQLVLKNDALRSHCENIVDSRWRNQHKQEISTAEAEIAQIHQKASDAVREAEQQLQSLTQEKHAVEDEKSAILAEIASSQQKLDGLLKEIERYEALGNDTVQAVRAKIGEAQKDMAGFIAELSVFMPQIKADVEIQHESRVPNHWRFMEGLSYDEDDDLNEADIEECSGWEDTLDILKSNLQLAGVGEQWLSYLSAVLYSAHINKVHLLLSGPNAKNIADAVSLAITGRGIPAIQCYGEKEESAILSAYTAKDPLIAVENPFHPDWISSMPYTNYGGCDSEKTMLWLHPFVEDLAIEPCGLYNYVLPIFTECFVEQKASWQAMTAGIQQNGYETYHSSEKAVVQMRHIKKLGISKLTTNRIQQLLNDAKNMSGISNSDMEYLFALLPFSVLNGKQSFLKDVLENEKSISSAVKAEAMRYIEEE